jgi:hypothetical protein
MAPCSYQGRPVVLNLKLPVLLNKFLAPLPMPLNGDTFFQKWNQLGGPPREIQQIIKAKEPVDPALLKKRVCADQCVVGRTLGFPFTPLLLFSASGGAVWAARAAGH